MPRVVRNYQRVDFCELLNELEALLEAEREEAGKAKTKAKAKAKTGPGEEPQRAVVSIARRRRSSKMDDQTMRYAYSRSERVIHDRECHLVKQIPDDEFEMKADFDQSMITCRHCYRNALIRSGLGTEGKTLRACLWFFNGIGASSRDLHWLLIEYGAQLQWQDIDVMRIHVKEDSWEIVRGPDGNILYHNNYIYLPDYSRYFPGGYHEQLVSGKKSFHNIMGVMLSYSWERHAELLKAEREAAEEPLCAEAVVLAFETQRAGSLWGRVKAIWIGVAKRLRNKKV